MRASIVRIGNSRGLRIPKALLDQCGITDVVDLTIESGGLMLRPLRSARDGWAQAASSMAARGDDRLFDAGTSTAFDEAEWEW